VWTHDFLLPWGLVRIYRCSGFCSGQSLRGGNQEIPLDTISQENCEVSLFQILRLQLEDFISVVSRRLIYSIIWDEKGFVKASDLFSWSGIFR